MSDNLIKKSKQLCPSGYDHCSDKNVDLKLFLPVDFPSNWDKFYNILKPAILIIAKYDVWPNQIKLAVQKNIPAFLVNASLGENSHKTGFLGSKFFKPIYQSFTSIFAITEKDGQRIKDIFDCSNVRVMGDTKFDQVLIRRENALKNEIINDQWVKNHRVLVFGSIWPEDAEIVLKNIEQLLNEYKTLKIILVPHQPTKEIIKKLVQYITSYQVSYYSLNNLNGCILLIDSVGLLAEIYKYADYAYIGGSFKQGIHNVMEAAVYGIPVIHGPKYLNSAEAIGLLEHEGSFVANTTDEFTIGKNGQNFALSNTGSTQRILKYLNLENAK